MSVSLQAESTTPAALVVGPPARLVAASQGHVWAGMIGATAIGEHVELIEHFDGRGDALAAELLDGLVRAASLAKQERAYQTHARLVEAVARLREIIELDDHEDHQRRGIRGQAGTLHGALVQSNRLHGVLLGQREAGDQPARCGREDRHEGPCVFVAVEDAGAAP